MPLRVPGIALPPHLVEPVLDAIQLGRRALPAAELRRRRAQALPSHARNSSALEHVQAPPPRTILQHAPDEARLQQRAGRPRRPERSQCESRQACAYDQGPIAQQMANHLQILEEGPDVVGDVERLLDLRSRREREEVKTGLSRPQIHDRIIQPLPRSTTSGLFFMIRYSSNSHTPALSRFPPEPTSHSHPSGSCPCCLGFSVEGCMITRMPQVISPGSSHAREGIQGKLGHSCAAYSSTSKLLVSQPRGELICCGD
jgi:hypothetical protein